MIRKNSLFHILLLLSVVVVVSVALSITWVTIRMSENFFIRKYTVNNENVMTQIKRNVESFHYSVILATDQIQGSSALEDILSNTYSQAELMNPLYVVSQKVDQAMSNLAAYDASMIIMGKHDFWYISDSAYLTISAEELNNSRLMEMLNENPRSMHYVSHSSHLIIAQALMNRVTNTSYGVILIPVKGTEYAKLYNAHTSEGNQIFIVNEEGLLLSSDSEGIASLDFSSLIEAFTKEKVQSLEMELAGTKRVVMIEPIPDLELYLVNIVDRSVVINGLIDRTTILIIVGVIIGIALLINTFVIKALTGTLTKFTKEIAQTSASNFKQPVTVSGTYETKEIAIAFNNMLDELQVYLNQLLVIQQQKREAELTALQRQINVHFLYNTLATIKFLIEQGKKAQATEMIHSLISLLQFTLGDLNEMTTVANEIAALEHYVNINQKRYGDHIRVNFFVTPNINQQQIPKLMIQPFIENAFSHGFLHKKEGSINIFIWSDNEDLICEVIDNGDGFDIQKLTELKGENKHHFLGLGIQNVRERVQLLYGEDAKVLVESKVSHGTTVRITLPKKD